MGGSAGLAAVLLGAALLSGAARGQQSGILPAVVSPTLAGGLSGTSPINSGSAVRQLALYPAQDFLSRGITSPILIEGVRFRSGPTGQVFNGGTLLGFELGLSTAQLNPGAAPLNNPSSFPIPWDQVVGSDAVTLVQGDLAIPPFDGGPTPGLQAEPFYLAANTNGATGTGLSLRYDPASGQPLCLDLRGAGLSGGSSVASLDFVSAPAGSSLFATGIAAGLGQATNSEGRVPAIELVYRFANGFRPDFAATNAAGPSPLTVTFSDATTYAPNSINLGLSWDLDDDGVFESTGNNVQFTYGACGDFNVSLRVTQQDLLSGAVTTAQTRKLGVVQADAFTASFTVSNDLVAVGEPVVFTAGGLPGATYSWDLDGDGVVDGTGSTITFSYSAGGTFTPRLDATRTCRTSSATGTVNVVDGVVRPGFTGPRTVAMGPGSGSFFDLDVRVVDGITINSLRFPSRNVGQAHLIEVYGQVGSSVDGSYDLQSFTLLSSALHFPAALDTLELVDVPDFTLPLGLHGIAVIQRSVMGSQVSQTLVVEPPGVLAGSGPVRLVPWGSTLNIDAQGIGSPSLATDQTFAGEILYTNGGQPLPPGATAKFGDGCDSSLGRPEITTLLTSPPQIGMLFRARVSNVPGGLVMHGGISNSFNATFGVPLPFRLGPVLGTRKGCEFRVSSEAILPLVVSDSFNNAFVAFAIPNNPAFSGLQAFFQGVVFDPLVPGGLALSDAWVGRVQ